MNGEHLEDEFEALWNRNKEKTMQRKEIIELKNTNEKEKVHAKNTSLWAKIRDHLVKKS